jgi:hypothetical protein
LYAISSGSVRRNSINLLFLSSSSVILLGFSSGLVVINSSTAASPTVVRNFRKTYLMDFDLFISHAAEDKTSIARPLAEHLKKIGYKVWFDEFELKLGDSLRKSIDKGLEKSNYGVVILSPNFVAKGWTEYELNSLCSLEVDRNKVVILTIWHDITKKEVLKYSPYLADKISIVSTLGLETICLKKSEKIGPSSFKRDFNIQNHYFNEKDCPRCGQRGMTIGCEASSGDEYEWFECNNCGYYRSF